MTDVEEVRLRLQLIETKLDKVDAKLDQAVEARTAIGYLKWVLGAAWGAITALGLHHMK